jgi:hypothetical protein
MLLIFLVGMLYADNVDIKNIAITATVCGITNLFIQIIHATISSDAIYMNLVIYTLQYVIALLFYAYRLSNTVLHQPFYNAVVAITLTCISTRYINVKGMEMVVDTACSRFNLF